MVRKWSIHHFEDLSSTQDKIKELISDNPNNDYVVRADVQTAGRGRHGREWVSPKGNLFMTLSVKPQKPLSHLGLYAYITALALYDALSSFGADEKQIALKWPNDLMVNDKKAAGILMEHYEHQQEDFLLIGMGVNLKNAPEGKANIYDAFDGMDIAPEDYLEKIITAFDRWEQAETQNLLETWKNRAWRLNEMITAKLGANPISGRFDSIDDIGAMIIQLENGQKRRITAGELFFGNEDKG